MKAKLLISFAITLSSWTTAQACSPATIVMTGEQNYSAISPNTYSKWDAETLSVGLVYVKTKGRKDRDVPQSYMQKEKNKKPFEKIKYKLVEDISGGFEPDEKAWMPAISKSAAKIERTKLTSERGFAFWDRLDLSTPYVMGYAGATSCGLSPKMAVLPGQFYLHFKYKGRTIGMEIVSGSDDAFVEAWKEIYALKRETKITRAPKTYFTAIAGYHEFELKTCPTEDEVFALNSGYYLGDTPEAVLNQSSSFEVKSSYVTATEDLRLIDLIAYQNRVHGRKWECKSETSYLVLDKTSAPQPGIYNLFTVTAPRHRYLEIQSGQIDTKDILSRIKILADENNSTKVNLDQVKSWIEYGQVP